MITMLIVFHKELLDFLQRNAYLKDFSWGWLLLIIPGIYLIGHIFGTLSFLLLQIYQRLDRLFKGKKQAEGKELSMSKPKYKLLMMIQCLLYRQRVVYRAIQYTKNNEENKYFNDLEEFWTICAVLQVKGNYAPAEYWNYLNEFFNSINLVFFISGIISIIVGHWIIGIICFILAFVAFYRAQLYAKHFVQTVVRTMKAMDRIAEKA